MNARAPSSYSVDLGLLLLLAVLVAALIFAGSSLRPYDSPELDPRPELLPVYLLLSLTRLGVTLALSVLLAIPTGYLAAKSAFARRLILPTLDIFQSVPIVGFFPVAVWGFVRLFGGSAIGVELAAIFLIFTSMFWNLAFSVYESLITFPEELTLAAAQFGVRGPLRWSRVVLPAVMPNLVYNSILSWANGWYFLTASEIIAVGSGPVHAAGLRSYLAQAVTAGRNDLTMLARPSSSSPPPWDAPDAMGPLSTWAERFHLEETGTGRAGRASRGCSDAAASSAPPPSASSPRPPSRRSGSRAACSTSSAAMPAEARRCSSASRSRRCRVTAAGGSTSSSRPARSRPSSWASRSTCCSASSA